MNCSVKRQFWVVGGGEAAESRVVAVEEAAQHAAGADAANARQFGRALPASVLVCHRSLPAPQRRSSSPLGGPSGQEAKVRAEAEVTKVREGQAGLPAHRFGRAKGGASSRRGRPTQHGADAANARQFQPVLAVKALVSSRMLCAMPHNLQLSNNVHHERSESICNSISTS